MGAEDDERLLIIAQGEAQGAQEQSMSSPMYGEEWRSKAAGLYLAGSALF
jgi:hypothetical protein